MEGRRNVIVRGKASFDGGCSCSNQECSSDIKTCSWETVRTTKETVNPDVRLVGREIEFKITAADLAVIAFIYFFRVRREYTS